MPALTETKSFNSSFSFPTSGIPIAVLVGGSGGIGAAIAERLSYYAKGNIHIVILARNKEESFKVLERCIPPPSGSGDVLREFVLCDYSLVSSTDSAIKSVSDLLTANDHKIDYLVFSSNYVSLENKRNDTEEGHDYQLRIRYYHRFQMTYALLSKGLLGPDSRVLTILGAQKKGIKVDVPGTDRDDFEFRSSEVGSFGKLGPVVASAYTDVGFKQLSAHFPKVGITHINPGFVYTGMIKGILDDLRKKPFIGPLIYLLAKGVVSLVTIQPEESAEYMIYALFNGKAGFYRRDKTGGELSTVENEGLDSEKFYQHSMKVTKVDG
ncbi:hypothetical protein E1B28_005401 [Marasmius oreades]|uniref:NAD(P)-binding protein n=1 Tax=Marasmius oreades TaxID=181124 RepID=A0A9P7S359_9AGAR|nr:uncharacterized protein E1B28_005401 [Marasmius oreades]KAG7094574.1 hypothetical protein E1B28_005401 [Marasmius oreades]